MFKNWSGLRSRRSPEGKVSFSQQGATLPGSLPANPEVPKAGVEPALSRLSDERVTNYTAWDGRTQGSTGRGTV
jgi:hypothetical protein